MDKHLFLPTRCLISLGPLARPSRLRRRERRAADRSAAAEEAAEEVAEEAAEEAAEQAAHREVIVAEQATGREMSEEDRSKQPVEEVDENVSEIAVTGSPIPQLDGNPDMLENSMTCTFVSEFHAEDIEYTLKEIFSEDIEATLVSRVKMIGPWSAGQDTSLTTAGPPEQIRSLPFPPEEDCLFPEESSSVRQKGNDLNIHG